MEDGLFCLGPDYVRALEPRFEKRSLAWARGDIIRGFWFQEPDVLPACQGREDAPEKAQIGLNQFKWARRRMEFADQEYQIQI